MKTLLIVYYSRTGGTAQMAEAVARGATTEAATKTRLVRADQANPGDILAADGYIFATPENLASLAGVMKDFFDRAYYPVLDRIIGRPYGILVCAGSDGTGAVRQIERIVTGWRLKVVAEPIIVCTRAQTPETIQAQKVIGETDLGRCQDLGAALASGLAMGIF